MDFSGLAKLYGWSYAQVASGPDLAAFLAANNGTVARNTILDLKLDPALMPVTAARHF
jgi:hypothetical protein